jgi:DNA-binding PadR family transcriptional regulator
MKKLTNNECVILGLIAEEPCHGYQLEQKINERGIREWTAIAFSSIYYLLKKLEDYGYCSAQTLESVDRPAKNLYQISPAGYEVLSENIQQRLSNPQVFSPDIAIGLAFATLLDPQVVRQSLETYRTELQRRHEEVQEKWRSDMKLGIPDAIHALFDRSLKLMHTELMWLDSNLKTKIFSKGE